MEIRKMKILNSLTIKNLLLNKRRTIVTIIGVILSTSLMVGIGLLVSSILDNMISETISYSGSYHVIYRNLTREQTKILDTENLTYFTEKGIGYSQIDSLNYYKPYIYLNAVSSNYFGELKLIEGTFPTNANEIVIPEDLNSNIATPYKVGDKVTLNIGNRIVESEVAMQNTPYWEDEEFLSLFTQTYTVVGITKANKYENYSAPGYTVCTLSDSQSGDVYVTFNKKRNIIKEAKALASKINYDEALNYNSRLLALYGESNYGNITTTIMSMLSIMLSLISVGCIIVIYNSFAISVTERKSQFALLSSIGASKKQMIYMIYLEALIIGIIGITLGILGAYIGIGTVIVILNNLLAKALEFKLRLVTNMTYIIVPIIFMAIVIIISAIIPAIRASRVTPIEAIRQNDDIKIDKKKIRTSKLITKIFGIEGDIALKNIKRNKKKYRITIVSLFISIVLFISFSAYLDYALFSSSNIIESYNYDAILNVYKNSEEIESKVAKLIEESSVKNYAKYYQYFTYAKEDLHYTDEYLEYIKDNYGTDYLEEFITSSNSDVNIIVLDDNSYNNYKKEIGLHEDKIILLNRVKGTTYSQDKRINHDINIIKDQKASLTLCNIPESEDELSEENISAYCQKHLNNLYITEKPYSMAEEIKQLESIKLIMNRRIYDAIIENTLQDYQINIVLNEKVSTNFQKMTEEINDIDGIYYYDIRGEIEMEKNLSLAIKILMYGFISLVTLIGVTSVFNTITTSIALRKREFAILRSIGLTKKGLNKMFFFESLFFGLKSLIYALPVSFIVIIIIHYSIGNMVSMSSIIIPWPSIFISIIGVFVIVLITMLYSGSKIKKNNIIDEIREENI